MIITAQNKTAQLVAYNQMNRTEIDAKIMYTSEIKQPKDDDVANDQEE